MPVLHVHVHAGGETIPATLSTEHAASSYGQPVLLLDGGPSHRGDPTPYGPGDVTRWGVAASLLLEAAHPRAEGALPLLDRWNASCASLREREGLPTMAETFLEAGGWDDGSRWYQGDRSLADELDRAPLDRTTVRHLAETPMLATRIPEGQKVKGLEYGAHVSRPGWNGYHVRPEGRGPYGLARLTSANNEVHGSDRETVEAIRQELAGAGVECAAWTFPDGSGVVEVGETWDAFGPDGQTGAGEVVR